MHNFFLQRANNLVDERERERGCASKQKKPFPKGFDIGMSTCSEVLLYLEKW